LSARVRGENYGPVISQLCAGQTGGASLSADVVVHKRLVFARGRAGPCGRLKFL